MYVVVVEFFHLERFSHENVEVIIFPLSSGKVLQEDQRILKGHFLDLLSIVQEEGGANVAMELGESFILREICIPQSDSLVNVKLSGEIAAYPPIGKVHKVNVEIFKVLEEFRVSLLH